ncbi:MAG: hypothetical protein Q7V31_11875 [Parvibaculum sp.]|uniref:hypothetical protein n=1 Tax=Parvibaculum sp. TaxID=2024848 RepID=UPI00272195DC|nr:hypothetical protein [Parvibaculum sp.]MDO8839617.1 hypothetical protein [Parvibaculum sp.]
MAFGAIAIALALIGSPATAQAEEPDDESLRAFLLECDSHLDDCRAYLDDAVMLDISVGMRLSNKPEPACVPSEPGRAADMLLAHMRDLARDPAWAEGPYEDAMMQAMDDAFPCLAGYFR